MALAAVMVGGLLNGSAITKLKITPIIATLAVNALLLGAVSSYTNAAPQTATSNLASFAINRTLGIPNTVYIAAVFVIVVCLRARQHDRRTAVCRHRRESRGVSGRWATVTRT